MTVIYELSIDIVKTYLRAKNELSKSRLSKVRALQTDGHSERRTDRQTDTHRCNWKHYHAACAGANNDNDSASLVLEASFWIGSRHICFILTMISEVHDQPNIFEFFLLSAERNLTSYGEL